MAWSVCSGLEESELLRAVDSYETAATPLGSFPGLFQQALSLGLLSRRRVHAEARQALGATPALLQRLAGAGLRRGGRETCMSDCLVHRHSSQARYSAV